MADPIRIQHPIPKSDKPFAILPCGMYCNAKLKQAKPGDILQFYTGWRYDKAVLVRKCCLQVNSSVFSFMAKSIYGAHVTIKSMLQKWGAESIIEGCGVDGFSREECLMIEVSMVNENKI